MISINRPNKFLPWNPINRDRDFSVNKFDFNQPLPGAQPVNLPILGPRANTIPPDFAGQYAKLIGNRPNRLAYEHAVTEGAPEIKRGNWAKLGAMLAGVGSNLGGESPSNATNLGLSSYFEPQRRSDEVYEKRVTGLGNLANLEESDLDRQIRGLESQQENYFKNRQDLREGDRLQLDASETQAQNRLTDAQINDIRDEMFRRDIYEWTDPRSGITFRRMPDGSIKELAKTKLTPKEEAEFEGLTETEKEKAREPGRAKDRALQLQGYNIGAESRRIIAAENNAVKREAIAAKLNNVAKQLKPGEAATQVWNDMTGAINSEKIFEEMGAIGDYIDVEGLGTSNAVVKVKPDTWSDSPEEKEMKARLRQVIATSYARSQTPIGGTGRGNVGGGLPPGWSQ